MKIRILVFLTAAFSICLISSVTIVQGEDEKPQLTIVFENNVKPSEFQKYEEAVKEQWGLFAEVEYPFQIYAYSSDDFHYYFAMPIENHAGIDEIFKADGVAMEKLGMERWQAIMKSYAGTFEYNRAWLLYYRPDLSYAPAQEMSKPEEINFIYWGYAYLDWGKEGEFEDILKQFAALYKSENYPLGFSTHQGAIGTDMPYYFWSMMGKSRAEFWGEVERADNKIGDRGTELWHKLLSCLRKYEIKTGQPRPDLSYVPKEK